MEFEFNCEQVTKADKSGFSIVTSETIERLPKKSLEYMELLIDNIGKASSKAQRLPSVITSFKRLRMNVEKQKIYFYCKDKQCLGFLKTGFKKLFVSTEYGDLKEINPLWVLDFYVNEEVQRQGFGKQIFDFMLKDSKSQPEKIAYDRPSDKLLKFLGKHFNLKRYLPQNNNFVIFTQYFTVPKASKPKAETMTKFYKPLKESEEESKGIYESKPSYRVTYHKEPTKEFDESKNIINKNYINNLINTSHTSAASVPSKANHDDNSSIEVRGLLNYADKKIDMNTKTRKMAANEESKDGFNQMKNYINNLETDDNHTHKIGSKITSKARPPLKDTTNGKIKAQVNKNPITGEDSNTKHSKTNEQKKKPIISKQEKPEEEIGADIDELIRQKEAELKEVMDRLNVSSKQTSAIPSQEKKATTKQDSKIETKIMHAPVFSKEEKKDEEMHVHGHPTFPGYNHNAKNYSANGMRLIQFHSKAPWATE